MVSLGLNELSTFYVSSCIVTIIILSHFSIVLYSSGLVGVKHHQKIFPLSLDLSSKMLLFQVAFLIHVPSSLWYKTYLCRQLNCCSIRCSWSIACRCYSNYIFILRLTPGFNMLHENNCKPIWEAFEFLDLVQLILEILRYIHAILIVSPYFLSGWIVIAVCTQGLRYQQGWY